MLASAGFGGTARQSLFRATTLGVRVDVLVTDGKKPVAGLTGRDFEVRDNGVLQAVEVVDAAEVPLNVVLALDTSGSTAGARRADPRAPLRHQGRRRVEDHCRHRP